MLRRAARLGLTLRVTLVTVGAMSVVLLIILGAFLLQNRTESSRLPVPDRVAAIVEVLEATAAANEPAVLRALDADDLDVRLDPGPWPRGPRSADFPALVFLTKRYLGALGERRVEASIGDETGLRARLGLLLGRDSLRTGLPLRLRVQLRDGRVAVIDIGGRVLHAPLAGQIAIGAAIMIVLTGLLSAWSLKRQIRPLETLARAVERFGGEIDGAPPLQASRVREVHQLVTAFDAMRGRVRALLEGRTRMLAAISHDLGTYLTRLRLRVDYIADPGQRERAELDLGHIQQLLRDTLTLARIDSAPETSPAQRVDLMALARRQLAPWLEPAASSPGSGPAPGAGAEPSPVALAPLPAGVGAIEVSGREAALARLLDNLVGNALKYAGAAEVSLRLTGGRAEVRVEDRGPGIPRAERELVLEPFYRLDRARSLDAQGSGLGLAIVADVVVRHRGELRLEERPGGGLRVRVLLPLAERG